MLCVPAARADVLHVEDLELAVPDGSAAAPHPLSVVPSAVKATLPVGAMPVRVAVNVTFAPTVDGLAELPNVVVVATRLVEVSVTASMKVVLSAESVPLSVFFFKPPAATEN